MNINIKCVYSSLQFAISGQAVQMSESLWFLSVCFIPPLISEGPLPQRMPKNGVIGCRGQGLRYLKHPVLSIFLTGQEMSHSNS